MISPGVRNLHELIWHPGRWMNSHWWHALDLAEFESIYQQYPACRLKLDKIINVRRQLRISALPTELHHDDEHVFTKLSKISALVSALGLVGLGARDALCIGHMRRALASVLGEHGCDQLLAMNFKWPGKSSIALEIDNLSLLKQIGWQWLKKDVSFQFQFKSRTRRQASGDETVQPVRRGRKRGFVQQSGTPLKPVWHASQTADAQRSRQSYTNEMELESHDDNALLLIQALDICFTPLPEIDQYLAERIGLNLDPLALLYKFARFL